MLTYKNNDPYIEGTSLYDLVKVCQTPFYVYSQQKIINQVNKTKEILGNNIFYSIKSNSNQAILRLMSSLDIGADVVSIGELKRSLSAGFDSSKIIFTSGATESNNIVLQNVINQNKKHIILFSFSKYCFSSIY